MEAANVILEGIKRNIREVLRLMLNNATNKDRCLSIIDGSLTRLDSLRGVINADDVSDVENSLLALRTELDTAEDTADGSGSTQLSYAAERPLSGYPGRPPVQIDRQQLVCLRDRGFTAVQMARQLNCSASVIYRRLAAENLQMRSMFSQLTDTQLDQHTEELHRRHNNAGNEMMNGYLRASGIVVQRRRVRQSLHRVDPLSAAARWSHTVTRRTYSVPTPNSLWHLDSHMKLIRWGFVTHGGIDGYSRVIPYLQTATSNEAKVVLNLFVQASHLLGLPSRVRCDHGGENIDVALFMSLVRGHDRGSVLTGRSVHNQRIERLWRDVASQVTEHFYKLFYEMEDEGILDISQDVHLYTLQLICLPVINSRMDEFRHAWNSHRLRTVNNRSPAQIWISGMLQNANSGFAATTELFTETPSLGVRIEQSLQHFDLTVQPFVATAGLQPPPMRYVADATAVLRVQETVIGRTDVKAMFSEAVQILGGE